jgi:chromosome segregation ATPase
MNELQKILTDVKIERDLLMKQLEQYYKEREALQERFRQMRDETEELLRKVKEDLKQLMEAKRNLERELFEKDEELAKKDAIIKNLTQKQLELGEAMTKFQRFLDAHNDLKRQLEDMRNENDLLREARSKAHKDLMEANKLLDIAAMGSEEY